MAYIDEVEEPSKDRPKKISKVYYSCLVKAMPKSSSPSEPVQYLDQVILLYFDEFILQVILLFFFLL